MRHGERADQVFGCDVKVDFKWDPPLTSKGMVQAADAAKLTKNFLQEMGYSDAPLKFIASPHIRTL